MRYMTVLFIPAAMGIMDNYSLLLENWIPIIFSTVGGSLIVLIFTAFLTENFQKKISSQKRTILSKDQEKQP